MTNKIPVLPKEGRGGSVVLFVTTEYKYFHSVPSSNKVDPKNMSRILSI